MHVMQAMMASAYIFCQQLQNALPAATHSTSINFVLVQETRPITGDWPALVETNGTWIYFVAQIQYAPSARLVECTRPLSMPKLTTVALAE